MEINLNVKDRLAIISILPTNGTLVEMGEIFGLIGLIKFTEEEKSSIGYREQDGKIYWKVSDEKSRDFDISFEQVKILKKVVKELDEQGKIDFNNYDICYKINSL